MSFYFVLLGSVILTTRGQSSLFTINLSLPRTSFDQLSVCVRTVDLSLYRKSSLKTLFLDGRTRRYDRDYYIKVSVISESYTEK